MGGLCIQKWLQSKYDYKYSISYIEKGKQDFVNN